MGHSEFMRSVVDLGQVQIEVLEHGKGPAVLFLASLGRGAEDYEEVASLVAKEGFRSLRLQPRGVGASKGPMKGVTLHDLADDVAGVIRKKVGEPAMVVGHAFGNFVARMTAADHPARSACWPAPRVWSRLTRPRTNRFSRAATCRFPKRNGWCICGALSSRPATMPASG